MERANIIPADDITKHPLTCRFPDCRGAIRHVWISTAPALAEHFGVTRGRREIQVGCPRCGRNSTYSYSDLLSLLPIHRRPRELPTGFKLAIAFAMLPRPQRSDGDFYLGERVLVEIADEHADPWIGLLRSQVGLAPSLPLGAHVSGGFMSNFAVIYGRIVGNEAQPLPIQDPEPGSLDTGLFYAPDRSPGTLLAANLFCTNPSCPHILGPYYSQAMTMIEQAKATDELLGAEGIIAAGCERCGMTRIISGESYNGLYKV